MILMQQLRQTVPVLALLVIAGCATAPKSSVSVNQPAVASASVIGDAQTGNIVQLPEGNALGESEVIVGDTYSAASGRKCRRLHASNGAPLTRVACQTKSGDWKFARDLRAVSTVQPLAVPAVSLSEKTNAPETSAIVPSEGSVLLLNTDGTLTESSVTKEVVTAETDSAGYTAVGSKPAVVEDETVSVEEFLMNEISLKEFSSEPVELEEKTMEEIAIEVSSLEAQPELLDTVNRELYANETLWSFAQRTTGNALNWKVIAEVNGISDAKMLRAGTELAIPVNLVGSGE